MDIFQRTLRCQQQSMPIEIELEEAETELEDPIEGDIEEEPLQDEEESIDAKVLMQELECMKRHIQKLQLRLKLQMEECRSEKECVDYEILLNCSENKEICKLQKDQNKLQCQISELVKCSQNTKNLIEDMRLRICENSKRIIQLKKASEVLMQWRDSLDHEFGKCIERFEYLKHVKAEWQDVTAKFDQAKKSYSLMAQTFVSKLKFQEEKKYFISTVDNIKEMLKDSFEYQLKKFECLERRFDSLAGGHYNADACKSPHWVTSNVECSQN
ncbi:uncharacterized protein LOC142238853 [Haematobia irritans]|uniref:uncharacterized protein LOC142238853 n=1 Tax=Haematobia irritans TaxID=7368 RepID=UPI003F4FDE7F